MTTSDDNELARMYLEMEMYRERSEVLRRMYLEMEMYRERYEVLRRMTPCTFQELWQRSLLGNFDDLVDDIVKTRNVSTRKEDCDNQCCWLKLYQSSLEPEDKPI